MSAFPIPGGLRRMHPHIRLLLLLTLLVRGGMYLGYPLQEKLDDIQAFHLSRIDLVVAGDLLIGNLRYPTGYALAFAPAATIAGHLGALEERFILLVQVTLSACIPFLLYDAVRRHQSRRAALFVALATLFDVFGLQWAHLYYPVWMVAFCFVLAIWIMSRALQFGKAPFTIAFCVAGVTLGFATLGRLNLAPAVIVTGVLLLFLKSVPIRRRLLALGSMGTGWMLVLLTYLFTIHIPSTGTLQLNCIGGPNLILSVKGAGIPLVAENGPATAQVLRLVSLPAIAPVDWTHRAHPLWQIPGPWVEPETSRAFLAQVPADGIPDTLELWFPSTLVYHIGPCETDQMLTRVAQEAVLARPLQFFASLPGKILHLIIQKQRSGWLLPPINALRLVDTTSPTFPLKRAWSKWGNYYYGEYDGARLWPLPVGIYSQSRDPLHALKLLALPALFWGLLVRSPLFTGAAIILLFWLSMKALIIDARPEERLIAPLWPLWPLLIGGMLADLWQRLTFALSGRRDFRFRFRKGSEQVQSPDCANKAWLPEIAGP